MDNPTREQILKALKEHTEECDGRYAFNGNRFYSHTFDEAYEITWMCLVLDIPVSDIIKTRFVSAIIQEIIQLSAEIENLREEMKDANYRF